jgi:hypothetical protein
MTISRPFQWYHSHADPIWPDNTFKLSKKAELPILYMLYGYSTATLHLLPKIKFSEEFSNLFFATLSLVL